MNNDNELDNKGKLERLIIFSKRHNVEEVEAYIDQHFVKEDNFFTEDFNQPYFDLHNKDIYVSDGNSLFAISISKGRGDIFGASNAHSGTDIYIMSMSNYDPILLFDESKFNENINIEDVLNSFNEKISKDQIIKYFNNTLNMANLYNYNFLSQSLKEDREIINIVLQDLEVITRSKHLELKEDDLTSPNGGLDVEILSEREIFFSLLEKFDFPHNDVFEQELKDIIYGNKVILDELKNDLENCEKKIYIAEHQKEYLHNERINENLVDLIYRDNELDESYDRLEKEAENLNEELKMIKTEIEATSNEMRNLESRKYNPISFFTEKTNDRKTMKLHEGKLNSLSKDKFSTLKKKNEIDSLLDQTSKERREIHESLEQLKMDLADLKYSISYSDVIDELGIYNNTYVEYINCISEQYDSLINQRNDLSNFLNYDKGKDVNIEKSQILNAEESRDSLNDEKDISKAKEHMKKNINERVKAAQELKNNMQKKDIVKDRKIELSK